MGWVDLDRRLMLSLTVLSVALTIALTFSTLEVIRVTNDLLYPSFPDAGLLVPVSGTARMLGYACLIGVVLLILLGVLTARKCLAPAGAVAFFIPAFGDFAASMFLLAGLGVLRVLWLPLKELDPVIFRLGDVALLPYWAVLETEQRLIGSWPHVDPWRLRIWVPHLVIAAGWLVLFLGILTWLHGKLEKERVYSYGIYKYTRHPQYVGFILWSYGILLFTLAEGGFWGAPTLYPSFPWAISTLTIICVALAEERTMVTLADSEYRAYQEHTPFMIPLPRVVSRVITAPHRLLLRKAYPETLPEILCVFVIYTLIIGTLSYAVYISQILCSQFLFL